MIIEKRRNITKVDFHTLKCGEVFSVNDTVFMKIPTDDYLKHHFNAVNLENGYTFFIEPRKMVIPHKAVKLVIED